MRLTRRLAQSTKRDAAFGSAVPAVVAVGEGFDDFEATVSGPLGIGTVRLEGDGRSVQLTDNDGERIVLEDAERDLYLRYGWTIPVRSLRYWALGIPDPALPAETLLGDDGQLERLVQGGWQVDITRYG